MSLSRAPPYPKPSPQGGRTRPQEGRTAPQPALSAPKHQETGRKHRAFRSSHRLRSKSLVEDGETERVSSYPEGQRVHPARPAYRSPRVVKATHLDTMILFSHRMNQTLEEMPAESLTCVGSTKPPKREEDRRRLPPADRTSRPRAQQTSKEAVSAFGKE